MQPTHIAKPKLVHAAQITNFCASDTGINFTLADGHTVDVELLSGSPLPALGDYLMIGDGFTYVMPKAAFEDHYMRLVDLSTDTRPGYLAMPPVEVCAAAEMVSRFFAENNAFEWALGDCKNRFTRGAGA